MDLEFLGNNNVVVPVMETVISPPKFAFTAVGLLSFLRKDWNTYQ